MKQKRPRSSQLWKREKNWKKEEFDKNSRLIAKEESSEASNRRRRMSQKYFYKLPNLRRMYMYDGQKEKKQKLLQSKIRNV